MNPINPTNTINPMNSGLRTQNSEPNPYIPKPKIAIESPRYSRFLITGQAEDTENFIFKDLESNTGIGLDCLSFKGIGVDCVIIFIGVKIT